MKALVLICFGLVTALSQDAAPLAAPGSTGTVIIESPVAPAAPVVESPNAPAAAPPAAVAPAAEPAAEPPGAPAAVEVSTPDSPKAPVTTPAAKAEHPNAPSTAEKKPEPLREPGLYATIKTSMGDITCQLFEKQAPLAVANFVGLSRGTKTWKDPRTGTFSRKPLYAGTIFHRVIPNFMIQGGDPTGTGMGIPVAIFKNETSPNINFDRKGRLAMANAGPNTNSSQFFITVAPYPSLNGGYSIFGQVVEGQSVADRISQVPRDPNDKPLTPVTIQRIVITRYGADGKPVVSAPAVHHTAPVKKKTTK